MTVTTTTGAQLREYQGRTIPAAGTYEIDPSHTLVEFVARHLMISKVRGRFGDVSGRIVIAEIPEDSSLEAEVDVASLNTGDEKRDEHLRSADFFDAENHPTIRFRSTGLTRTDGGAWQVSGDLSVRGVTKPVVLDVEFDGASTDPWGGQRVGFTATTEVDREDWGLTWNVALETGGVLVGKKARLELTAEARRIPVLDAETR